MFSNENGLDLLYSHKKFNIMDCAPRSNFFIFHMFIWFSSLITEGDICDGRSREYFSSFQSSSDRAIYMYTDAAWTWGGGLCCMCGTFGVEESRFLASEMLRPPSNPSRSLGHCHCSSDCSFQRQETYIFFVPF